MAPCSIDPEKWFGYQIAVNEHVDKAAITEARTICLTACPLHAQRQCAQFALDNSDEWGVWAGIELPGGQYRNKGKLEIARDMLRDIASGAMVGELSDDGDFFLEIA